MHPLATEYDEEYLAEVVDAINEAQRHRNDAHRPATRRGNVIYTLDGSVCRFCGSPLDDARNCEPQRQCDGVL
jgi:hypothetical protein